MVIFVCREAVVPQGLVLPDVVDGLSDFVDGEGVRFQLRPLGVIEGPGGTFDFVLGLRVKCVLGGCVLAQEAVSGGLEQCRRVVGDGVVFLSDCVDGAVAGVGYGVVEVAYGFLGEFVARVWLMFVGDAL